MRVIIFCLAIASSAIAPVRSFAAAPNPTDAIEPAFGLPTAQETADETIRIIEASSQMGGQELQRRLIAAATGGLPMTAQEIAQAQNPNIHYAPDQRAVTTREYAYRADGKISGYRDSQEQAEYYYDALGRRVAKKVTQGSETFTQTYVYEGTSNRILQAKGGDGTITTYLDGQGPNDHLGESKNGVYKGYVTDHSGSILNGEAAGDTHSFGLFGEPNDPPPLSSYSSPTMYGFQGMQYEPESQKYFTANRTYDPHTGRWLSQDPIGYGSGDPNFYRAMANNPLRYTDPTGKNISIYVLPPDHEVLSITDPKSPTGVTYVDFYPTSGTGLFTPTNGTVAIQPSYPLPLIPVTTYTTTPAQDLQALQTAQSIQTLANMGQYQYTPLPPITGIISGNSGTNCWGFGSDICNNRCK